MSDERSTGLGRYAREIERQWSELLERPVVLSRRDWDQISDWYARGIPLELIREELEASGDRRRGRKRMEPAKPRSLAYLGPAVEEAWAVVQQGRLGSLPPRGGKKSMAADAVRRWRERISREPSGSPLQKLLVELLQQLRDGTRAAMLDSVLDERLTEVAPRDLIERVKREVEHALEPFRHRMPAESLAATRSRALVERLRSLLDLPPLANLDTDK